MYQNLTAQIEKAQADLRAAQEAALAALEQLREQYRAVWAAWAQAGKYAGKALSETTLGESEAIIDEMHRITVLVQGTRPDAALSNRLYETIRLDKVREEVMSNGC